MNQREREIFFHLLIDLFVDGKQKSKDKQQRQGEHHEEVFIRKARRSTELGINQATENE